jgi:hypothetical protein
MEIVRASVDRIEGEYAVAYSDQDDRRFDIPLDLMSRIKPGSRVLIAVENDSISEVREDAGATKGARERIRKKYRRLREGHHL